MFKCVIGLFIGFIAPFACYRVLQEPLFFQIEPTITDSLQNGIVSLHPLHGTMIVDVSIRRTPEILAKPGK